MQSVKADRSGARGRLYGEGGAAPAGHPAPEGRPRSRNEEALRRVLPAAKVARRTGRRPSAVYARRRKLQLPDGRRRG
jgi:hypothetical protein